MQILTVNTCIGEDQLSLSSLQELSLKPVRYVTTLSAFASHAAAQPPVLKYDKLPL